MPPDLRSRGHKNIHKRNFRRQTGAIQNPCYHTHPRKLSQRVFKRSEMPLNNGRENVLHGFLVERLDADDVEMSQEARCHIVPAPSWGPHCRHHDDVHQFQHAGILPVEPVPLVDPLPQDFYRRLCPVLFLGRHIEIIHEHHQFLPKGWAIYTFLPP